jgi:hypothetical protein
MVMARKNSIGDMKVERAEFIIRNELRNGVVVVWKKEESVNLT